MKRFNINSTILIDKLSGHNKIKNNLLKLIDKSPKHSLDFKNKYFNDHIEKLDYHVSASNDREWIKILLPYLIKHFKKCAINLGFKKCNINDLWFQQYIKGDLHGWHIHGHNYTGVYYLELSKKCPLTELVDSNDLNKRFKISAKEGDIVIFPSFIIHRSGRVLEDVRKTIISFNITFEDLHKKTLERLSNE